jgi:G3E family GTPase
MIVDVVFGFLGSGKTTFISRVMQQWGEGEKIVVLVNEFGDVGIDGDLLAPYGGDVVEMPSGCICCTLQSDFRTQILNISRSFHPDRLIIEPSGVATITTIDWILRSQILEPVIERVHKVLIVDVTGFKSLYKANHRFVESQVEGAHLILLNKCDRVDKQRALLIRSALSSINPDVLVLPTEFGAVEWEEYAHALSGGFAGKPQNNAKLHRRAPGAPEKPDAPPQPVELEAVGAELHIPHFQETEAALGYQALGHVYEDTIFDPEKLRKLFDDLNTPNSDFGEIVRAKGIFCIGEKWMALEQASGAISTQPMRPSQQSKCTIIGKNLNKQAIQDALDGCRKTEGRDRHLPQDTAK